MKVTITVETAVGETKFEKWEPDSQPADVRRLVMRTVEQAMLAYPDAES